MADKGNEAGVEGRDIGDPDVADNSPEVVEESADSDTKQEPDVTTADAVDPEAKKVAEDSETEGAQQKSAKANVRQISVSVRTLLIAAVIAAVVAGVGVLAWLYVGARTKLDEQARGIANDGHAERIALDYAVDAAKINAQDLDAWKKNLVKGTTPELKEKLSTAANSMQQILVPLQWNSTAVPLVAKVRTNANGIYVVDTFVAVDTKTMQAPDGLQSTATYSVTIDSNHDWQISDVGGIGAVVGQK